MISNIGQFLPATVVGAIVLFIIKEIIESVRRYRTNGRKRKAVRRLISDEIERNYWVIKSFKNHLDNVDMAFSEQGYNLQIKRDALGRRHLRLSHEKEGYSQSPILNAQSQVISSNLFNVADVDEEVFPLVLEVSDSLRSVDHLVDSLIEQVESEDEYRHLDGFAEYARGELNEAEAALVKLYKKITGSNVIEHRVR